MKLEIGYGPTVYGTVELSAKGLVYAGDNPQAVKRLVESMRKDAMTDQQLLDSLPKRLRGRVWAKQK